MLTAPGRRRAAIRSMSALVGMSLYSTSTSWRRHLDASLPGGDRRRKISLDFPHSGDSVRLNRFNISHATTEENAMKRILALRTTRPAGLAAAMLAAALLTVTAVAAPAPASPAPARLTNLSHLDFLLDDVPLLAGVDGHTTYRQAEEPTARAPWVYADRQADGGFSRVGGGPITDPARGWYAQGAFDADDIS